MLPAPWIPAFAGMTSPNFLPMKTFLRQQLERYPIRLQELEFFLQQPEVVQDMDRFRALTREHAEVSEVAALFARFLQREGDLAQAREMLEDPEMAEMAREEIAALEAFHQDPACQRVHASCFEVYGAASVPANAIITYQGNDPETGPLCKYTVLNTTTTPHADTP